MQIPNLPTDNLYKFLALSGLLLMVVSVVYPELRISEMRQKLIELQSEVNILDLEASRLEESNDVDENKAEKLHRLRVKTVHLEATNQAVRSLIEDLNFLRYFFYIGFFFGNTIMWLGFGLWYYRVQRPQDRLLNLQIDQLAKQLAAAPQRHLGPEADKDSEHQ